MNYPLLLAEAFAKSALPERAIGCCRVYVSITDDAAAKEIAKAAKKLGRLYQKRSHYGARNALYIGYDNCDGFSLARATAVVETFKAAGIACYRDENGD